MGTEVSQLWHEQPDMKRYEARDDRLHAWLVAGRNVTRMTVQEPSVLHWKYDSEIIQELAEDSLRKSH